ncbi:putative ATPase/DNA-binding CsgD family transcriptional regulator [Rhodococcus sp. LBL1]|nr:putative ATPase/DNA-binding CsgD family transcriptional regulator [Rhodococcus sp. LBL1]MDH6682041.1 putative ATPase/DNA-binding CsgD family transcriptional regulator [Rhodococcus sp. LBL2]
MTVKVGNLPFELTSFVGRRSEVSEVRHLVAESRLVTLTGLGGVGKTRLALRVAEDSRRVFADGAWFVELGELHDPALLEQTVISALGIQDRSTRAPRAILIDHLGEGRVLLVLDNCEHLVAAVADQTADLLRHCPGLTVLATSREPLGVPGEIVTRVPPLAVPDHLGSTSSPTETSDGDAVALFEQRAQGARPDFRITEENRAAVARICRRLEGLPLPIELAAARLRAMSVDEILRRLDDRFQLLTRGLRNAPSRQQTLRYSIDWSFDLCTPQERWLWARLTVFAGSFELDAVESVLAGESAHEDLLDLVTSLVDKSILIREEVDTTVRYRMLETLRDYGWDQLDDPDERTDLQRRHRDWYEDLVLRARSDWIGPRQVDWTGRLDREQPNLWDAFEFSLTEPGAGDGALRIATALHDYLLLRGRLSEGRYWLDRALEGDYASSAARAEAIVAGSVLASLQRDVPEAAALAEQSVRLAHELSDADASALAEYALGFAAVAEGDIERGCAHLENAIARYRAAGDLVRLVPALYWLGCALYTDGDLERASTVYQEQLALTEPRGEIMWRALALSDYGSSLWRRGIHEKGIALLEDALRLLRKLDNLFGCAWCFEELAWASVDRDPDLAAVLMGAADAQFTAIGSPMATFGSLVVIHDACTRSARNALGDRGFDAAFEYGRSLELDEVTARALGERPCEESPASASDGAGALTPRETEIAELVATGMTNKAIAERLVISQRTVEGHVEHIREKLGFTSRTQIVTWVIRRDEDT